MQRKNCPEIADSFVLKDRSNQELLDGAKHLVGRHRTVTAHLVAHLAEIDARKLHVIEGFSHLAQYCVGALGLSEDEGWRRAHAALLAKQYPIILDMLLEGSIHLSTLRTIGQHLTPANHEQVLKASQYKNRRELEHLVAALFPRPDVPTMLRKLPEPRRGHDQGQSGEGLFAGGAPAGAEEIPLHVAPPSPTRSRMAPLSPERYNLQVTIDRETYEGLLQLQELLRHQVRNGDLARIIKDSVLERAERVKRGKFGYSKRSRKARKQESWVDDQNFLAVRPSEEEPAANMKSAEAKLVAQARAEQKKADEEATKGDDASLEAFAPPMKTGVKRFVSS